MKSKEMINLELKEEINNVEIWITLKEVVKLLKVIYPNYCVYSLYNMYNNTSKMKLSGFKSEIEIVDNKINLLIFIKLLKERIFYEGTLEGEKTEKSIIKNKFIDLFDYLDINIEDD